MLTRLRNLRIAAKVAIAPLLLVVSMVILAVIFSLGIQRQGEALSRLYRESVQQDKHIATLSRQSVAVQANLYRLLSWKNSGIEADKIAGLERQVRKDVESLKTTLDAISTQVTDPAGRDLLKSVDTSEREFAKSVIGVLEMISIDEMSALVMMLTAERQFDAVTVNLDKLTQFADRETATVYDDAEQVAGQAKTSFYGLFVLFLALGGTISLGMARLITGPVTCITQVMARLAEGNTSVAIPLLDRQDEIGAMAHAVEVFRENRQRADRMEEEDRIRRDQEALRAKTLSQATSIFDTEIRVVLQDVTQVAAKVSAMADKLRDDAESAGREAGTVAAAAQESAGNISAVAAAAEELGAAEDEISRRAADATAITQQAVQRIDEAGKTMETLSEAALRIGEIVNLINDIAGQTNLLALNATIEAARAGEAGKGFAVVAGEVKHLATQTAKATGDIADQVAAIQSVAQEAVTAISDVTQTIGRVDEVAASIAAAVEEQSAATREIARNVSQAANGEATVNASIGRVYGTVRKAGETGTEMATVAHALDQNMSRLDQRVRTFLNAAEANA